MPKNMEEMKLIIEEYMEQINEPTELAIQYAELLTSLKNSLICRMGEITSWNNPGR